MIIIAALLLATTNQIVKVEGKSYRVQIKGQEVTVADKSIFTKPSLQSRRRMRQAVKIATGCEITDDYWNEAKLEGILVCQK